MQLDLFNKKTDKILISACLLGFVCRWHGKKSTSSYVRKFLVQNPHYEVIPVCPEMLGGLPCPRTPVKRRGGQVWETCPDKKLRKYVTGVERTKEFTAGARKTLQIAKKNKIKKCLLCKWSPSCDINGITGRLLLDNGYEVINTF